MSQTLVINQGGLSSPPVQRHLAGRAEGLPTSVRAVGLRRRDGTGRQRRRRRVALLLVLGVTRLGDGDQAVTPAGCGRLPDRPAEGKGVLMSNIESVSRTGAGTGARTALRVTAVLCTLELLFQGATAGQIFSGSAAAVSVHGGGAIVFHVLSALMLIAAALLWRAVRGSVWPTVISALVFVLGLVQAYIGDHGGLSVHVPLAIALSFSTVWVVAWSYLGERPAHGV
jgi:hypothetical protein